ncbi:hypothetical protein Bbelb_360010 [Branchiostoma belcheri]|nr:hypothetical protein Bbelb_360010 [Branchiostoma belcheri]
MPGRRLPKITGLHADRFFSRPRALNLTGRFTSACGLRVEPTRCRQGSLLCVNRPDTVPSIYHGGPLLSDKFAAEHDRKSLTKPSQDHTDLLPTYSRPTPDLLPTYSRPTPDLPLVMVGETSAVFGRPYSAVCV